LQFPHLNDLVRFWHETWNHADVETMVAIVTKKTYTNLPAELTAKVIRKHFPICVACPVGNLAVVPMSKKANACSADIGEEWEVDIKGPWSDEHGKSVKSFSNCRYCFVARDRKSKKIVAFLIRTRSNLQRHLLRLIAYVISFGRRVKLIRTDNELLKNDAIKECLENHPKGRIELQACIPYEHGQIGGVERSHRTLQDCTVKALYGKQHLSPRYFGMAYLDAVFKYNTLPRRSLDNQTPDFLWFGKTYDLLSTPFMPFGSIVMAHRPTDLQTALSGRSFVTHSVGCAPEHKGGLLLFNPATKRYIIRRSFKVLGPSMPGPYAAPIQFEATDTYTDESDGPEISDNLLQRHPADIDPRLNSRDSLQLVGAPSKSSSAASSSSKSANFRSARGSSSVSCASASRPPLASTSATPAALPSSNSSSSAPQAPPAAVATVPLRRRAQGIRDSLGTAIPTARHACALSAVMDDLISSDAPLDKFSTAVDAYIDALPPQKTSKLKKRKDVVVEAIYKKPTVSETGPTYQGKTRQSRPFDPSQMISVKIPRTMRDVLSSPLSAHWLAAKDKECDSFKEKQTYKLPSIPISEIPKDQILPSMFVFDLKKLPDGSFDKFKCRIVVRGDRWKIVFEHDTYAGTARSESIKIILAIAAELDMILESVDVKTAFLYPELKPDEIIYMRRPAGLTDADMPEVVQLTHCIYGLPSASAYFREHSDKTLKGIGFKPTISDPQVYTMSDNGDFIIVSTHVDDFGFASTSQALIDKVKKQLAQTYELSYNHDMSSYLGLNIQRNRSKKQIFINQPGYIDDLKTSYNLSDTLPSYPLTPMRTDYGDRSRGDTVLYAQLDKLLSPDQVREFQSRVGALSYLSWQSRPDILFAVNTLSRKTREPNWEDWEAVNRVLNYVVGTRDLGLLFHSGEGVKLYATVDASYATHSDLKSHTGCTFHLGRHSASFKSITKKQTVLADSSTVAEYVAAHLGAKEIMWIRNFLFELGFEQQHATTLFEDNQSTIKLIGKPGNGNKTKLIDLRFNFIREQVAQDVVKMEYLPTTEMISDILTKPLGISSFLYLRSLLLGISKGDFSHDKSKN